MDLDDGVFLWFEVLWTVAARSAPFMLIALLVCLPVGLLWDRLVRRR